MKCPYCFKVTTLHIQKKKGSRIVYYCSRCLTEVPKGFIDSPDIPYIKIGLVGYSGHGKTTFLTSLLHQLTRLHTYWDNYYFEMLDDNSRESIYYKPVRIERGESLSPTRAIFPRPTFIQLKNVPEFNNCFVSFFDTGGRLFENLDLMTSKGRFLAQSDVIFFFVSLAEEDMTGNWNLKIMKLLDRYIHVIYSRFGIKTQKNQSIVFILTKADRLLKLNGAINLPDDVISYNRKSDLKQYWQLDNDLFQNILENSQNIENWLRASDCNSFINLANNHFKKVSFVLSSSLSNFSEVNELESRLVLNSAKCMLEPLLLAIRQNS